MNTYGLHSVNQYSFNSAYSKDGKGFSYPRPVRNVIVTCLKLHNLTLNILGYIPGVSTVSGCIRIGSGLTLCAVTLLFGDRKAQVGMIIQPFYDEALLTGISQIARGVLEALVPSGWMVNALLDAIFTIPNLLSTISCNHCTGLLHSDPKYFPLLQVLNVG